MGIFISTTIIRTKRLISLVIVGIMLSGCAGNGAAPAQSTGSIASASPSAAAANVQTSPVQTLASPVQTSPVPTPTPSRHPDDPIKKYPTLITGPVRSLSEQEMNLLYGSGDFFDYTLDSWKELGEADWRRDDFSPEDLLSRFQPGALYETGEVVEFLAQIGWLWPEEKLLKLSEKKLFFDTWEKEIPLEAQTLTVCFVGLYPVDPEDYPDGVFSQETLGYEEGALYVFTRRGEDEWRLLHRISDYEWQGRTQFQFAVNESDDCAWLVEEPPEGSGSGYESHTAIWRNLVSGGIDLHYVRYLMDNEHPIFRDDLPVESYTEIATVLYGLRYDWFPDGTRFIRAPDRLYVQIEKYVKQYVYTDKTLTDSIGTEATCLVTAEFICSGKQYQLISLRTDGEDKTSLFYKYTDIGGPSFKSGMPSFGYGVR